VNKEYEKIASQPVLIFNYNTIEFEQRQLIFVPNPKPRYGEEPKPPNPFRSWFEVEVTCGNIKTPLIFNFCQCLPRVIMGCY
jgi:hypothetical protein